MKKATLFALTTGISCLASGIATRPASAQTSSVAIASAVMSRGYNGKAVGPTSTFKSFTGKIHCVATMNKLATFIIGSVWIAVDAGGKHNYAILQKTLPAQRGRVAHFAASLPRPWPVGKYRVDLFLNGKLVRSVPYTVTA